MPRYLKRDAVRLFEASEEALHLAIVGLGLPRRSEIREEAATYAIQVGLIGVAVEQAMSACLVQAYGTKFMLLDNGHYKSGSQILESFRRLVRDVVPRTMFLTKGVRDAMQHREDLYQKTTRFRTLIGARAGGLHAGMGPSRDVAVTLVNDAEALLETLAASTRIRPYLSSIPQAPELVKDRQIILEDLARRIRQTADPTEQAQMISAVYLIIPDVPEDQPDWLDAFERIAVAPRERDLSYLLNVLEHSRVGTLFKVSDTEGEAVPVVVNSRDDRALPIAPQYLRREFTQTRDQFHAEVALANGRLRQGRLDLPPADVVADLFVLGLERAGFADADAQLTAHQTWPYIISSVNTHGTPGPYWFLVRRTADLAQLIPMIERAVRVGRITALKNRREEIVDGMQAIRNNTPLSEHSNLVRELTRLHATAERRQDQLPEAVERARGSSRELSEDVAQLVQLCASGTISVTSLLLGLVENGLGLEDEGARKYWARMLSETAMDEEHLPGLLAVLRTPELSQAHTAVKKAMRLIDFLSHGPSYAE